MSPARAITGASRVFRWNPTAGRYIDGRGRFVPRTDVRRALDVALANTQREIDTLSLGLQSGTLSLDEWIAGMRVAVKDANLYSAALARGGWAQMTPADFGRVGRAVRDQYAYLDRFAADLANGYPMDGRFTSRARLYGLSGRPLFHAIQQDDAEERGAVTEENILGPAEKHCKGGERPGCIAESARGRVPLGTCTPIGQRQCLGNCRCRIAYFDADGTEI